MPTDSHHTVLKLVSLIVKETKAKSDIAAAVIDALEEAGHLAYWDTDTTLYLDDSSRTPTHVVDTPEGVTVEYRQDRAISYRFPAGSVVEVGW